MRLIAILAVFNERRFIRNCLEGLISRGAEVYLLDNDSTDETVEIAGEYLGRGLVEIERLPRYGMFDLAAQLERKEEIAATIDADWFMHVDADEVRVPPPPLRTFPEALAVVEQQGFNAVNFMEYTFIPTVEAPDHDRPDYEQTMHSYYPFLPYFPHRVNLWKNTGVRVDLISKGGHQVQFPGLRMYPQSFLMRHYLYLSLSHAVEKYAGMQLASEATRRGWHGWRTRVHSAALHLPHASDLRTCVSDETLDPSNPRTRHHIEEQINGYEPGLEKTDADPNGKSWAARLRDRLGMDNGGTDG